MDASSTIALMCVPMTALLYTSPIPAIVHAWRTQDNSRVSRKIFLSLACVSHLWAAYGLTQRDPNLYLVNLLGGMLALAYLFIHHRLNKTPATRSVTRYVWMYLLPIETAFFLALFVLPSLWLGIVTAIFCILMYLSPLAKVRTAIKNLDRKLIPWHISVAMALSGGLWAAYGISVDDLLIIVPKSVGCGLGILQLLAIVFIMYQKHQLIKKGVLPSHTVVSDIPVKVYVMEFIASRQQVQIECETEPSTAASFSIGSDTDLESDGI
eukprot:GILJ01014502.1.p1 GENE.GILJ01014502.1~~GILJ01014502.1.p1  ORF type:complete len:267 (-),score=31.36 GILJ01014502.1:253-1053(-)